MNILEAFQERRKNLFSAWSSVSEDKLDRDDSLAVNRLNSSYPLIQFAPSFNINRNDKIFCMGSCFAREIEDALENVNIEPVSKTKIVPLVLNGSITMRKDAGGRAHAFLNRYNAPSMLQEIKNICSKDLVNESLLLSNREGNYMDYHYTPGLLPTDLNASIDRRKVILKANQDAFNKASVFIFTFGLCEAFMDKASSKYLNVTPHPRFLNDSDNIEFSFINYEKNIESIIEIIKIIKEFKVAPKIILTVSPVPLDLTFCSEDIITANSRAKATLLAAVRDVVDMFDDKVIYFPSYEMVTLTDSTKAWQWDRRHVQTNMVNKIIELFKKSID